MNVYLVVAIIAGIGLIVIALVLRRPRTAEDVLGQPGLNRPLTPAARPDLRSQIASIVERRSTGILTASNEGQTCSLAFLFGHLFHAWCGSVEGEDALRAALAWRDTVITFNAKAMLPTRETITRPVSSILAEP
jgi:hypothetical protein